MCIVLCNGVFCNVLHYILQQRLWVNPSRSVVSGALGRYLKLNLRADNTSAVTVFLDPPGRPKREASSQDICRLPLIVIVGYSVHCLVVGQWLCPDC